VDPFKIYKLELILVACGIFFKKHRNRKNHFNFSKAASNYIRGHRTLVGTADAEHEYYE
jgi:hypothetical protein